MQNADHSPAAVCLRRRWSGFGTTVALRLWPRPERLALGALRLSQSAAFLRRAERRLSRFRPASELSLLNQQAGTPVAVSRLLFRLVTAALAAARATDGLFDPTVHRAMLAAGYTRSFDRLPAVSIAPVPPGAWSGGYRGIRLDGARRTIDLPAGVGLDLGGIAKGWLADMVLRRLRPIGAAAVDLGGDVAFTRPEPHDPPWLIDVAGPWGEGRSLAELTLADGGGVATSGILRRRWQTSQGWQHHLIDPRSGRPATTDLVSVTVLGPSAAAAEVMAKVVLLLGRERGTAALARNPRFSGVLVLAEGTPVHVGRTSEPSTQSLEVAS